MKDLFLGITIGAVAGAMIASNPKARKMASKVKSNMTDICNCDDNDKSQSEKPGAGDCGCGCGE